MNVLDEVMHELDGTGRLNAAVNMTGRPGLMSAEHLPEGWATVIYFAATGSDVTTDYHGPVLWESVNGIALEVWGESITLPKKRCVIVRPVVPA